MEETLGFEHVFTGRGGVTRLKTRESLVGTAGPLPRWGTGRKAPVLSSGVGKACEGWRRSSGLGGGQRAGEIVPQAPVLSLV